MIRIGNVDDAFLLFETLNDRGLQLSAADLVKSHLLSRIEAEKGEGCRSGGISRLERGRRAPSRRRHRPFPPVLPTHVRAEGRDDGVFKLFKKRLADETAASLLDHLKTMSRYFGEFILPSTIPEALVRDVIEDLNDLRAATTYVVLLPAREALQGQPESFVRLARLTEALAFRWTTIVGKNAQQLESIFQQAASTFTRLGAEGLAEAETILRDAMPPKAEFVDAFRAKRMGTVYVARYTLRKN